MMIHVNLVLAKSLDALWHGLESNGSTYRWIYELGQLPRVWDHLQPQCSY